MIGLIIIFGTMVLGPVLWNIVFPVNNPYKEWGEEND